VANASYMIQKLLKDN